jgi:thymidine kinase
MPINSGYLEIICGPMFSGKTEELIKRIKRLKIAKKRVVVIKHILDTRYKKSSLYSHSKQSLRSRIAKNAKDVLKIIPKNIDVVTIDESMWFGIDLIPIVNILINEGKHVIVSGLSVTFDQQPFEPIPSLMAIADKIYKLNSVCNFCGKEAIFHKKMSHDKSQSFEITKENVGKNDVYKACCRECFKIK